MPSRRDVLAGVGAAAGTALAAGQASGAESPDLTWSRTYAPTDDNEIALVRDIVPASDGFTLVGVAGEYHQLQGWIGRVDVGGRAHWHRRRGTAESALYAGHSTADGATMVAGVTNQPSTLNEPERGDPYVARVDRDGETPWVRTYQPAANQGQGTALAGIDDGYVMAGGISDVNDLRPWVARIDDRGNRTWTWRGSREGVLNDAIGVGGRIVVCGATRPGSTSGASDGAETAWIGVLTADGTEGWQWRPSEGEGNSRLEGLAPGPEDGVVALGRRDFASDDRGVGWLVAFDGDGRRLWERTYPQDAWNWHQDVAAVGDGYVLVGTREEGPDTDARGAWLLRVDAEGHTAWEHQFETGTRGFTVVPLADGGFLVGGDSDVEENDSEAGWLAKLGGDPAPESSGRSTTDLPSIPGWTGPFLAGGIVGAGAAAYWRRS